jgi:hypothetical protein
MHSRIASYSLLSKKPLSAALDVLLPCAASMNTNTLQRPTGRDLYSKRQTCHSHKRLRNTKQAAAVTCSLQTNSNSGSTGTLQQHNPGSCAQFEPRSSCLNHSRVHVLRLTPHAAGRGGSRGRSSDERSSSAWQDRVYNAGDSWDTCVARAHSHACCLSVCSHAVKFSAPQSWAS